MDGPTPAPAARFGIGTAVVVLAAAGIASLPFDMPTSPLWFIAWGATLVAAFRMARDASRRAAGGWHAQASRLTIIGATVLGTALGVVSSRAADAFARDAAQATAAICARDGVCPALPPGWDGERRRAGFSASYELRYWREPEQGKRFALHVLHDIDHSTIFDGGISGEVTETHRDRDAELAGE